MSTLFKTIEMTSCAGKRKHVSQMNRTEKRILWARLKGIGHKEWGIKTHALKRLEEKSINATENDLISTIHNSELIEYKIDDCYYGLDERVVVRSKAIVNECYNLNVVYSLTTKRVVTVWMNHVYDCHKTLDWSIYDKDMMVFKG